MQTLEIAIPASSAAPVRARTTTLTVAHKFGGSSLADSTRIRHVAGLLRARDEDVQITIVSAMQGVTDALIGLTLAASRRGEWHASLETLRDRHLSVASGLLTDARATRGWLAQQFADLAEMLHAINVLGGAGREIADAISGLGEVWSAHLIHAHLRATGADYALLDARDVLVVRHEELGVAVDWERTESLLSHWREANAQPAT
jgi:aspartokinase/homoserine dehydrogenase 1